MDKYSPCHEAYEPMFGYLPEMVEFDGKHYGVKWTHVPGLSHIFGDLVRPDILALETSFVCVFTYITREDMRAVGYGDKTRVPKRCLEMLSDIFKERLSHAEWHLRYGVYAE